MPQALSPESTARLVLEQMPDQGLFAGHEWRVSAGPFNLGQKLASEIDSLGRIFLQFYRAVNLLYRKSAEGKQPEWIARSLDAGKPDELIRLQREQSFKNEVPRVIRPDLLLSDSGLSLTELDSVPGGIGLTAWLNQTYAKAGSQVLGGADGMLRGFSGIFGTANTVHIVVSEEAGTYRPEMEWVAGQLSPGRFHVRGPAQFPFNDGDAVYRFFELFDLANVPCARSIFEAAAAKRVYVTPPPKPLFEEKMLFALLWNRNLREYWRQELGESFFRRMQQLVPYTWLVDPSPLPPHAAIPELNITDWQQLKALSQKERDLILKVSGYSPEAWGARGVHLGSDLSHEEWGVAVDKAIQSFNTSSFVLQQYHKPALVDAAWFDPKAGKVISMRGRVRLCPYYFVQGEPTSARAQLGGVLATICPPDKKIIHGMTEAIFAPCSV